MLGRITVGLFFFLLVWGNLVAGLKAGLGCPDWPLCHGKILPPFRWDIYMEFTHRVIGAVAGLFLVALSWRRFKVYKGGARAVPVLAVGLLATEVVLGGVVVLLEIPAQLTTVHFMMGLAVFLLAYYMMTFDGVSRPPVFSAKGYGALFLGMTVLVFALAALGAYVRHSGAGLAISRWPLSNSGLFPAALTGPVLIQFSHRVVAALVFLTVAALYAAAVRDERLAFHRKSARDLFLMIVAQVLVGGVVILSGLSFLATGLHLAVALGMLMILVAMWSREIEAKGAAS
ncbi:MAG: COX15/CtaA family protein [Deltaproteobacteria bacterium]|nr:COX15/CtaA family protein [Deltaproteobacteria bacterium]